MADQHDGTIESVLYETRNYPPPADFAKQAIVQDASIYDRAREDPEGFWAEAAKELDWFKPWDRVLDWNPPQVEWFSGGLINASYNCVDRHVKNGKGDKPAIIWEGEPEGEQRTLTYADLEREVNKAAAMLKQLGIQKGDRVAVYMPMIPELPILMLACARLGAPHSVVFAGFSPDSLSDRINDCQAKLVVTADGGWRRGRVVPLKDNVDEAVKNTPSIEHVLVVERIGRDKHPTTMQAERDIWWHDALPKDDVKVEPEQLDAEHPLYILYTSGTTGKPKGILHTTGGYLTGTSRTTKWVFDLKDSDIFWCTADIGWVTGHSYIVYGPLANGVTEVMYEGAPDWPDKARFWDIIERHKVTVMYTAPTSIRSFMGWGREYPEKHDLSSLRLLGTVGEPINPEAWVWYNDVIGGGRCPIVDTWWQTETGAIMITPLPGVTTTKPGSATFAFPGIQPAIVDERGNEVPKGQGGFLVIKHPWPSMLRSIWGDPDRYVAQYFSKYGPKVYVTGDGARQDEAGYYWLMGRVDDVLNVAGHRLGTMELESALVSHPAVAEAAVIGVSHPIKGQGIAAFCRLRTGVEPTDELKEELRQWVGEKIGPIARPDKVYLVSELPKTRSAKIMRRLLRDIAEGKLIGDTTTLTDPGVLEEIKQGYTE